MLELLTSMWAAQAAGVIAFFLIVLSFQSNVRKNIMALITTGLGFQTIHFLLLGAMSGALMVCLSMFRNCVFSQKSRFAWARHPACLYSMLVMFVIASFLLWEGWLSIFPLLGTIGGTVTFWMDEPRRIRLITLFSAAIWIPYMIAVPSYPGLALQIFIITSVVVAMYRYDRKQLAPAQVTVND